MVVSAYWWHATCATNRFTVGTGGLWFTPQSSAIEGGAPREGSVAA